MMEYKCPSCGAALKVNEEYTIVKCEYCETVINLETEVSGFSSHRAVALAEKVRKYKRKKAEVESAKQDYELKNLMLLQFQNSDEKTIKKNDLTVLEIWAGICFFLFLY